MDTKFSVALHVLTMISESEKTLSSEDLAQQSLRNVITNLYTAAGKTPPA